MVTEKKLGISKTTRPPSFKQSEWDISHGVMVELLKILEDRLNSRSHDKKSDS